MKTPFRQLRDEADRKARLRSTLEQAPVEKPSGSSKGREAAKPGLMRSNRVKPDDTFSETRDGLVGRISSLGGSMMARLASESPFAPTIDTNSGAAGGVLLAIQEGELKRSKQKEGTTGGAPNEGTGGQYESEGDPGSFVNRLIQSESSGNTEAEITIGDGRRFVGGGQFGEARLADYKKSTGTSFTQDEFQRDPNLQKEVMTWHIADIDKAIASTKGSDQFDRDGLRAVAHLGGIGGMRNYVRSGGQHDPEDELGTSLSDYYRKFST